MDNKDITINELAVMVKNGFDGADRKVSESFRQVDSRLDRLENNQRTILSRLEDVVYKTELDQLKERVKIIEEAIALKSS